MAKLKERLMTKKLTSLKSNYRRQRTDNMTVPSKTVATDTETETRDGSHLVGLSSEKHLKIDSGLVSLKSNEHRFNKRSSVQYPLNGLKVNPTSEK